MTMSVANHSELERLRCLHRGVVVALTALTQLRERSPENELRLRTLQRLSQRMTYRMEWIEAQVTTRERAHAITGARDGAAPESVRSRAPESVRRAPESVRSLSF